MEKKTLFGILMLILLKQQANAQNGLEQIIVERYYKTEANDTNANSVGGILPVGSVTYRIYADMLPGYKFQAAFGIPNHELRLETTTLFFNNEDRGAIFPTYTKNQSRLNTVMLDSWLSVGAGCAGYYGILKADDDGINTNVNNYTPQVLQGTDTSCGIPISQQDGLIIGVPEPVTTVGIDTIMTMFANQNDGTNGPLFSTFNGSWASLNGSAGPDSLANQVLIAQITTDGIFSFKLNLQIGTPTGGFEQYVAENPTGNEIQIPSLIYQSNLITTARQHTKNEPVLRIYPNPARDFISVDLDVPADYKNSNLNIIEIFSVSGTVVFSKQIPKTESMYRETISVDQLPVGIYVAKVTLDGRVSQYKFVKLN